MGEAILCVNKLISEFNKKQEHDEKIEFCTKDNFKIWNGIKNYVKKRLSTEEARIFSEKFEEKLTYLNIGCTNNISSSNYYEKTKLFYDLARNYMYFHHLILI